MRTAGPSSGSGVVIGWGLVGGRPVVVASHDAAVASGAIGAVFAETVQRAQRIAIDRGHPIVYINDSGGARIHDGIHALHGCGGIFANNVEASRKIPQISLILGPCAGAAAYSPALTDWTIMVKEQGQMFLTGPEIVRAATGEDATADEIGGSGMHTRTSGVAHLEVDDEQAALDAARGILSFLPSHVGGAPALVDPVPARAEAVARLPHVVPDKSSIVFDMHEVLDGVLDDRPRLELSPGHAPSVLTVLAHLDGRPVGIVANQPKARGGILDAKASVKASRFVDFCARYGLPVLTFVDVPGFLPGTVEEGRGVITQGATMLRAYVEAQSPVLTVVVRKAYAEGRRGPRRPARRARRRVPRERRPALPRRRGGHPRRRDRPGGDARPHGAGARRPRPARRGGPRMSATTTATASADIVSNVWKLVTEIGAQVRQGDVLAVLESMKMELPVHAPATGTVAEVLVTEGQIVQEGDPLVVIATADEGPAPV